MQYPRNKFDHHKFEIIMHEGFYETLDRCAGDAQVDFDTPKFVECVKASAINYATFTNSWLLYQRGLRRSRGLP